MILCPFRLITGWDCPMCGATRATLQLLHAHIGTAFDYNAMYVLALPFIGWMVLATLTGRFGPRPLPTIRLSGRVYIGLTVVAVAFTVVRNLPYGPGPFLHT